MEEGKAIKVMLLNWLLLWTSTAPSHWGPSEKLSRMCLRIVPLKDRTVGHPCPHCFRIFLRDPLYLFPTSPLSHWMSRGRGGGASENTKKHG